MRFDQGINDEGHLRLLRHCFLHRDRNCSRTTNETAMLAYIGVVLGGQWHIYTRCVWEWTFRTLNRRPHAPKPTCRKPRADNSSTISCTARHSESEELRSTRGHQQIPRGLWLWCTLCLVDLPRSLQSVCALCAARASLGVYNIYIYIPIYSLTTPVRFERDKTALTIETFNSNWLVLEACKPYNGKHIAWFAWTRFWPVPCKLWTQAKNPINSLLTLSPTLQTCCMLVQRPFYATSLHVRPKRSKTVQGEDWSHVLRCFGTYGTYVEQTWCDMIYIYMVPVHTPRSVRCLFPQDQWLIHSILKMILMILLKSYKCHV